MGTKEHPGEFDCYTNAALDEPMFVLLARDKHAPALVRLWVQLRAIENEDRQKLAEAEAVAYQMEEWRAKVQR